MVNGPTWDRSPPQAIRVSGTSLSVSCEVVPGRLDISGERGYFVLSRDEVRRLIPYLLYFADNGKVLECEE